MSTPADILNRRYGDVFLSKSKNLKIVSAERGSSQGENYAVYTALLNTGAVNPVVISALVQGAAPEGGAHLRDLDWDSLHVRSYNSWDDLASAGVELRDTEPQKPMVGAIQSSTDLPIRSTNETENAKVYSFGQKSMGRLTLFTSKPSIATGGNDLPRKTTFLPWLSDSNFVYEK